MNWLSRPRHVVALAAGALALAVPVAWGGVASAGALPAGTALPGTAHGSTAAATSPSSPVNLTTQVNFADGVASRGATVMAGDARFEVLGDGLSRLGGNSGE